MALTPYSLCPGGTGKKLKFCCAGCLEELEKIYKFTEAQQYSACLKYIDSLLEKEPDRACLLAIRCQILELLPEKKTELLETAKRFFELHPESPVAVAESVRAMMIQEHEAFLEESAQCRENGTYSGEFLARHLELQRKNLIGWISQLLDALNVAPVQEQTVRKILLLVRVLTSAGMYESAFEWIRFLHASEHFQEEAQQLLSEIVVNKEIPLCLRVMLTPRDAQPSAPWAERFNAVIPVMRSLRWAEAENEWKKLAAEFPGLENAPEYRHNLAMLQEWRGDIPAALECWKKFLAADGVDFDSALEIQTRVFALSEFPLEDQVNVYRMDFTLTETDAVKETLLADQCVRLISQNMPPSPDGSVALTAYEILDGEKFRSVEELNAEGVSVEDLPVVVASAILWARQTDKEPRLEVMNVLNPASITEHLGPSLEKWTKGEVKSVVEMQTSATMDSFSRELDFPPDTPREKAFALMQEHLRNLLLDRWVYFPLGVLDRMPAMKAAADPAYRLRVEACVETLRESLGRHLNDEILNDLRAKLSLPALPEIAPEKAADAHPMFFDRVDVAKIPENVLSRFYHKCIMYGMMEEAVEAGRRIVDCPEIPEPQRFQTAYFLLRVQDPGSDLHGLANRMREFCEKMGLKHSQIDLMEMEIFIAEDNRMELLRMLRHLQEEHRDDPEVIETLMYLQNMAQRGAESGRGYSPEMMNAERKNPAGGGSGLWTPDNPGGGAAEGGASKLWVPD